jgi:hypothetical protein
MQLLAIDPGNVESALLLYDTEQETPVRFAKLPNDEALLALDDWPAEKLAVEMIASYGMAVGASVFDTCVAVGRFLERWTHSDGRWRELEGELVFRREVKMHLCGSMRAKDANIRQALLDLYGGKEHAIGRKAAPGPLYGIAGDVWSALAVAVTVAERVPVAESDQLALV